MVGMSGGVDSSVAAALLKDQGYDVAGVIMEIYDDSITIPEGVRHACYGPGEKKDLEDARRVAQKLEIDLHVLDMKERYRNAVLRYFFEEYGCGKTPNPCMRCNRELKFGAIQAELERREVEFDYYATGHYARIVEKNDHGRKDFLLNKAVDKKKDQSYFLYYLKENQLKRLLFPLGEYRKTEVRKLADKYGLDVADRPESQDFVAGGYRQLFHSSIKPGPILNRFGETLGEHNGLVCYTVGQRRGIGIGGGKPLYVVAKDLEKNAIIVGPEEELYAEGLIASSATWVNLNRLKTSVRLKTRIRYRHKEAVAEVSPMDQDFVRVMFEEPQKAVAPGQAVVFYDGDTVIGGGIIEKEVKNRNEF